MKEVAGLQGLSGLMPGPSPGMSLASLNMLSRGRCQRRRRRLPPAAPAAAVRSRLSPQGRPRLMAVPLLAVAVLVGVLKSLDTTEDRFDLLLLLL